MTRDDIYAAIWPALTTEIHHYAARHYLVMNGNNSLSDATADAVQHLVETADEYRPATAHDAVSLARDEMRRADDGMRADEQ